MAWSTTPPKQCSPIWERHLRAANIWPEEFKCAKASLEMTSTKSKDPVVKSVAPTDNSEEVEGKIGCTARTGSSEANGCPGLRSAWAWWLRVGHW